VNLFRSIWRRLRSLAQSQAAKREIDDELRFHLEQRTAENIATGMSQEQAARAARSRFGNFQSVREACRDNRSANFGGALAQDIRFGLRTLRKDPGFTLVAVLTLAVGIGACTAMFGLVDAVLLRPLPFARTDRLVWIENHDSIGGNGLSSRTVSVSTLQDWRRQTQTFQQIGAYNAFFDYVRYTLTGAGEPERLRGVAVTQNFLDTLGVRPLLGRNFTEAECVFNSRLAAGTAVILTHAFWRQHFGGDTGILGKSLILNGQSVTVVGVLPSGFDFDSVFSPGQEVQVLVPFPLTDETARWGQTVFGIGRLKDGATLQEARSEFAAISRRLEQQNHLKYQLGVQMRTLDDQVRGRFRTGFSLLFSAVIFILLIACVNLSNLLLTRANGRRKEFAVRLALGADRWRLARQTLTESFMLSVLGCAAAVPMAFAATRALSSLQTFGIPLLKQASVDGTALAFTAGVSVFAGLLCGLLPALYLARQAAGEALNDVGARSGIGRSAGFVRRTLVVSEVALACLLLVGAGLLIRSFIGVLSVDLGFQPRHAVALRADAAREFDSSSTAARYFDQLASRVAAVPGVESVGLTDTLPLGRNREFLVSANGESYPPGDYPTAFPRLVDNNYLQAMEISLREGRYFDGHDVETGEKVVIINETLARQLWPGRDSVGQIMNVYNVPCRVVGVVADVRHSSLEEKAGCEFYFDIHQANGWSGGAVEVVVRTSRPVAAVVPDVRAAMKEFDPTLPTGEVTTLEQIVDRAVAPRRLITNLLGGFSALALTLAAIGLYGVISYSVGQRTREIGIRMAVGAQRHDVLRLVISEGLKTAMLGVAVGLVAAVLLSRALQSMLFGVGALDPITFVITAVTLIVVSLLSCWLPAHRAARVDPMVALRYE
jgi:predicted permease